MHGQKRTLKVLFLCQHSEAPTAVNTLSISGNLGSILLCSPLMNNLARGDIMPAAPFSWTSEWWRLLVMAAETASSSATASCCCVWRLLLLVHGPGVLTYAEERQYKAERTPVAFQHAGGNRLKRQRCSHCCVSPRCMGVVSRDELMS
eukprot:GHRR01009917.1.p1 GENE.GHRR01009917.1~~GHRR01009917.1.p1  ORF type:complete len:148 (-),score=9.67 GHRR01009917.1:213-656(-)